MQTQGKFSVKRAWHGCFYIYIYPVWLADKITARAFMHSNSRNLSHYGWTIALLFIFLLASCLNSGVRVTFGWEPLTSLDLAGYKIYYKTSSSGPPYDGKGLSEGDSPIVVPLSRLKNPNDPRFTVHGLRKDETYFFAITAYGFEGKECKYSNEIQYPPLVPLLFVHNVTFADK